jgi:hypothetical protein
MSFLMNAWLTRLVRAWLVTALIDALFSSCLVTLFYGSTVAKLWEGVAAVPFGPSALQGGTRFVIIGLALHLSVALTWSTLFLILYSGQRWLRELTASPAGVVLTAVVYGPLIWMMMSFVVIPHFRHLPPTINYRWWVQFFGHIPFVALPIVTLTAAEESSASSRTTARTATAAPGPRPAPGSRPD